MANGFLSQLGQRAPQIALAMLAAKQGGPEAAAAFQQGLLEAQQMKQAQARQAQLDEERRGQQAFEHQRAQRAEGRADADDRRADEAQRMRGVQSALDLMSQYEQQQGQMAPDATTAENALLGRASMLEGMFGVPQGQLSAAIPSMGPTITTRDKKRAQEMLDGLSRSDLYKGYFTSPAGLAELDQQSIVWKGQPIKVAELRQIAESTIAPKAVTAKPDVPNTPEEQFYQRFASERGATAFGDLPTSAQAAARKQWMQADDRPQPQATVLIQTIDAQGNPVQRLVPRTPGTEFAPAPTAGQQTAMAEQETGIAMIGEIERLFKPELVGPVTGRATRLQMQVPGAPDVNPEVAGFHASVAGLRNEIIRLMSGAAVSGSEEARMRAQLPDVTDKPSVFQAKLNQTKRNRETLLSRMQARSGAAPAAPATKNPFRP